MLRSQGEALRFQIVVKHFTTCNSHQTKSCTSTSRVARTSYLQELVFDEFKLLGTPPYLNEDSEGNAYCE